MPAHVGIDPRSKKPIKITSGSFFDETGNLRTQVESNKYQWDLTSGWRHKRPASWEHHMQGRRKSRVLRGTDGKAYKIWYYDDYITDDNGNRQAASIDDIYDSRVGWHAHDPESTTCQRILAKAEKAFADEKELAIGTIDDGHIRKIEYSEKFILMRVTFYDGTVCIFDKMPSAVAGELIYLMNNNARAGNYKDGRVKHAVGVRFWDYVRIRGQHHGACYPFEYAARSNYKLTKSRARYKVRMTKSMLHALYPNDAKMKAIDALHPFRDNELIDTVLSEEELAKYAELTSGQQLNITGVDTVGNDINFLYQDEKTGQNVYVRKSDDPLEQLIAKEEATERQVPANVVTTADKIQTLAEGSSEDRSKFAEEVSAALEKKIVDWLKTDDVNKYFKSRMEGENKVPYVTAIAQTLNKFKNAEIEKIIDRRTGHARKIDPLSNRQLGELAAVAFGKRSFGSWKSEHEGGKLKRASDQNARGWTKEELKAKLNYTLPDGVPLKDSRRYREYIRTGNWEGALNALKGIKVPMEMKNDRGEITWKGILPIAGRNDFLEEE